MSYDKLVTIDTPEGTAAVNPDQVVLILEAGKVSDVVLANNARIRTSMPADEVAKALWEFTNKADDGFFNDQHVLAVVPHAGGSRVLMTGGARLDNALPTSDLIKGLESARKHREKLRAARS